MNLRLITAPTEEPVSLETAKSFLRVDGTLEDPLIQGLVSAARETGEELARRAWITQTWEQTEDAWPVNNSLKLYRPPLQSVTSVKYMDSTGVESTWTDYRVDTHSQPGRIIFNSVPSVSLQESGAITVRFVAGYGTASAVPGRVKNMIQSLIAYWYEMRMIGDVPDGIKQAFISERVVFF